MHGDVPVHALRLDNVGMWEEAWGSRDLWRCVGACFEACQCRCVGGLREVHGDVREHALRHGSAGVWEFTERCIEMFHCMS